MTPEHVEAARRVAEEAANDWRRRKGHGSGCKSIRPELDMERSVVDWLEGKGMLRNGMEKRAVEACEQYAENYEATLPERIKYSSALRELGRESLALKQPPKPRWTRSGNVLSLDRGAVPAWFTTFPDDASADVAMLAMNRALNACDTEATNA